MKSPIVRCPGVFFPSAQEAPLTHAGHDPSFLLSSPNYRAKRRFSNGWGGKLNDEFNSIPRYLAFGVSQYYPALNTIKELILEETDSLHLS
jgi:hypothetical protein